MTGAREQLDRVKWWLSHRTEQEASAAGRDALDVFFILCWALKSRIMLEVAVRIAGPQVERDVQRYDALMVAAAIATRTTRLTLVPTHHGAPLTPTDRYGNQRMGAGMPTRAPAHYGVTLADGSTRDALAIAQQAVVDWESILTRYGL